MPLLSFVSSLYPGVDLSKTTIIACQHILRTQLNLFDELEKKGLRADQFFLIGKSYSTNRNVFEEFKERGVNISAYSNKYDSHKSFDSQFHRQIQAFLLEAKQKVSLDPEQRIIFVDCGGVLIAQAQVIFADKLSRAIAIEQTSSGYEVLKAEDLQIPVLNVARARAKALEAPYIAEVIEKKVIAYIQTMNLPSPKILIIGQGYIGKSVEVVLRNLYPVTTYDKESLKSGVSGDLKEHLGEYDIIIGATGATVLDSDYFPLLKKGVRLISVSSSDREFSSVTLRKYVPATDDPHAEITVEGVYLVNAGFPLNFDGTDTSLPPERAQLVVGLMLGSIYEAAQNTFPRGFVELNPEFQERLVNEYKSL